MIMKNIPSKNIFITELALTELYAHIENTGLEFATSPAN
jgi:hypothetical protein